MLESREPGEVVKRDGEVDAGWSEYVQRLATQLRRFRQAAGLSQEDVAYRAGLTRYTYQKYEKGESRTGTSANPSLRSLLAIAQVLEIDLAEMMPGDVPDLRSR